MNEKKENTPWHVATSQYFHYYDRRTNKFHALYYPANRTYEKLLLIATSWSYFVLFRFFVFHIFFPSPKMRKPDWIGIQCPVDIFIRTTIRQWTKLFECVVRRLSVCLFNSPYHVEIFVCCLHAFPPNDVLNGAELVDGVVLLVLAFVFFTRFYVFQLFYALYFKLSACHFFLSTINVGAWERER